MGHEGIRVSATEALIRKLGDESMLASNQRVVRKVDSEEVTTFIIIKKRRWRRAPDLYKHFPP